MNGFPDLLCIGLNMDTILIEVKIVKGFKISLSPHQISMNIKLWNEGNKANYIIALSDKQALGIPSECPILYEGLKAKHLALNGVNEPPTAYTWPNRKTPEMSHLYVTITFIIVTYTKNPQKLAIVRE